MAPKSKAAAPELADYAEKDPTELQEMFADWLSTKTGYDVDVKSVALATSLRGAYQKSPENQDHLAARREAAEQRVADREKRAEEREAKAKAPAPAKKAAPAKKTAAASAPATKVAPPKRRRPAAAKAAVSA